MPELGESSFQTVEGPRADQVGSEAPPVEAVPGIESSGSGSPVFYHAFEDDLMSQYADRIIEQSTRIDVLETTVQHQEDQIQELQEEVHQHQNLMQQMETRDQEQQTRIAQLEQESQGWQETAIQLGALMQYFAERDAHLTGMTEGLMTERDAVRAQLGGAIAESQAVRAQLEHEVSVRVQREEQLSTVLERTHDLEVEGQRKRRRIDRMGYAFSTGFGRLLDRVYFFPPEEGQTQETMSRSRVIQIGIQEYGDAVDRGMLA